MQITILKRAEQQIRNWTGGTTTELAIFTEHTSYTALDFLFRISTSTVDAQNATFTELPGVSRELMILEGQLNIQHQDQYSKSLEQFDTDSFEGDWITQSTGNARDFNLMTRGVAIGKLEHLSLPASQVHSEALTTRNSFIGLYINKGAVIISTEQGIYQAEQYDHVSLVAGEPVEHITIRAEEESELIISRVWY